MNHISNSEAPGLNLSQLDSLTVRNATMDDNSPVYLTKMTPKNDRINYKLHDSERGDWVFRIAEAPKRFLSTMFSGRSGPYNPVTQSYGRQAYYSQ